MEFCAEYLELISAYGDGELSPAEKAQAEEHLNTCESCSAFHRLSRATGAVVSGSCVPAPESLSVSVMKAILDGDIDMAGPDTSDPAQDSQHDIDADIDAAGGGEKKRGIIKLVLTRYLPAAACLAILLLTLPTVLNLRNAAFDSPPGSGGTSGGASSKSFSQADSAVAPESAPDGAFDSGAGYSINDSDLTGSEMPAPAARDPGEVSDDEMPIPEADLAGNPADDPADGSFPENEDSSLSGGSQQSAPGDVLSLLDSFSDAYAWIEVTGELPEVLSEYDPVYLEDWLNWEMYYRIPRGAVLELLDAASFLCEVTVSLNDSNSDYAIVFYSSH